MAKKIAVISYDLNPKSLQTTDAIVFRETIKKAGYIPELVHQWCLDETNTGTFLRIAQWEKYHGVVICGFYQAWNLREVILSRLPVLCANSGYVDDLGLGEREEEHASEDAFNVVNNSHPITSGFAKGPLSVGEPVWLDSVSCFNHHVDVLVTTLGKQAVLAAHKTHPLAYFGWYRMSQASAKSSLFKLLTKAANWAFK